MITFNLFAIAKIFFPPDFLIIIFYIGLVYGIITLFISGFIKYFKKQYFTKVLSYLVPESKIRIIHLCHIYSLISLFIIYRISKDLNTFQISIQLFFQFSIVNIFYWNYKTVNFINKEGKVNPENIKTDEKFSLKSKGDVFILRKKDYTNIKQYVFYFIYINLMSYIVFNNYKYAPIYLLLFLIIIITSKGSLLDYVLKINKTKKVMIFKGNSISFKNIDYIQLRKIDDINEGLHDYVLSIVLKTKERLELEQSRKYLKILEFAKSIADVLHVSIKEY